MKTMGVVGGLGPQATMDFEARVHQVAQGLMLPRGSVASTEDRPRC
jgi:aspartate/glutamate racemase